MPMLVSVRSPSTVMTLMPLALAAFNGAAIAFGSVTEIMIAPGLVSATCWTIAVCFCTSNVGEPVYWNATPLALASVPAPQLTVL